jgi:hypothetical protein
MVTVASVPTVPDTLDPQFWVDIDRVHETFRNLRAESPVACDDTNDLWWSSATPRWWMSSGATTCSSAAEDSGPSTHRARTT